MIKKLIEKLYYKCYPDRVHEHEIARMPIPNVKVEQYKTETIQCAKIVMQEEMKYFGDDALKHAKRFVLEKMLEGIEPFITFKVADRPELCAREIRARLTVVDRR